MDTLPDEMLAQIFYFSGFEARAALCQVSQNFARLCEDDAIRRQTLKEYVQQLDGEGKAVFFKRVFSFEPEEEMYMDEVLNALLADDPNILSYLVDEGAVSSPMYPFVAERALRIADGIGHDLILQNRDRSPYPAGDAGRVPLNTGAGPLTIPREVRDPATIIFLARRGGVPARLAGTAARRMSAPARAYQEIKAAWDAFFENFTKEEREQVLKYLAATGDVDALFYFAHYRLRHLNVTLARLLAQPGVKALFDAAVQHHPYNAERNFLSLHAGEALSDYLAKRGFAVM